jgi:site-specific DNA recombinase
MSQDDTTFDPPAPLPPRSGPRTRGEIERERSALADDIARQIDRLAKEYHDRLPLEVAKGIGAIYARYSSLFQHSIVDQVRTLFEAALKQGIFIPRENICFDMATPGYKDQRPGLNRLRELLASGGIDVFLVFTTNRLFRKTYKALQFVEEEVVGRGIRCLFVKSGVDSADEKRWRMLLQIHAMTDEFMVGMYTENVRSAHEGLFQGGLVFGTVTFGYRGREIQGPLTKRGRPRRLLEVDPEVSLWVRRAFTWFADDGLTINEIARRFNADPNVPPSPRSLSGRWCHNSIHYLLTNARYRGWWQYGTTENVWQGKQDYSRQVARAEPLKAAQWEHLRIVPDDLWFRAQDRLARLPKRSGRKPADGDRESRPRLLNGLLYCPVHDRPLYVGGPYGKVMYCKDCRAMPAQERPLFSLLNRTLARSLTCRSLVALVRPDDDLVEAVVAACRDEAGRAQRPDPARIDGLRRQEQHLGRQIRFVMENPGETEVDRRESGERLRSLRRSRAEVALELARREADRDRPTTVPSEEEVRALLVELGATLEAAAAGDDGDDAGVAREVVELMTGGRIELEQQGERKAQRGWLRGRFRPRLIRFLAARAAGVPVDGGDDAGVEVFVDYREPTEAEDLADRVKALYDEGKLIKEVAAELKISRNLATKAHAFWYRSRGLEVPDGRSRRATLEKKHLEPPKYARLADEAKRLWDEGLLMEEIGERLDCDRTTLTRAIAYWHELHGLPVPDGRTRRKTLARKSSRPYPDRRKDQRSDPPGA